MSSEIRILGISGSLRQQSYNTAVLRSAVGLAPEGVAIETFELDGIPPFNQDEESSPPAKVLELKRSVRAADGAVDCSAGSVVALDTGGAGLPRGAPAACIVPGAGSSDLIFRALQRSPRAPASSKPMRRDESRT